MVKKKDLLILLGMFLVALCLPLATHLVSQSQENRSNAATISDESFYLENDTEKGTLSVSAITPLPEVWDKETYDPIVPKTFDEKLSATSDTLKVWTTKTSKYNIYRIWAKEPYKQLHTYNSNDYGKNSDSFKNIFNHTLSSNANGIKNKIAIAFNQTIAYNYYSGGFKKYSDWGLIVHESKVLRNDPASKVNRLYLTWLDTDSKIHYLNDTKTSVEDRKKIYSEVINGGVLNTFSSRILVRDGKNITKEGGDAATLQAFCQIDKNNFIYTTTSTYYRNSQLAKLMISLGCKNAYLRDGGGSTNNWFKKASAEKWTHIRGSGERRPAWVIIYWTEL